MKPERSYLIGLIEGDGIGPELVREAIAVLEAATERSGAALRWRAVDAGAGTFARTGRAMSEEDLAWIRRDADAVLKGPVGLPEVRGADGTEGGLLGGILRTGLDAYANLRPLRLSAGVAAPTGHEPGGIDMAIVRENTEGLYLSRGKAVATPHAASDQMLITAEGTRRIARFAFRLARTRGGAPEDGVRRVTCVDKSNVLGSHALFRRIVAEVHEEFPDTELDFRYADAAAHDLVVAPERFDVIVCENFLGDILSDLGAALVGGLGFCGSGNIGEGVSYFEPVHGSAPALAGRGEANPLSQIRAGAMMLRHLGEAEAAGRIERAVDECLASGRVSIDPRGRPVSGTSDVATAVAERVAAHG